jgi:DNA-binding MarR family transcriptional regulator
MVLGYMRDRLHVVEQLVRVETRLWNQLDRALSAQQGLSLAQLVALRILDRTPGSRVQDLALEIDISPGGASKFADRLVAAGLVERSTDTTDRRASRLQLTSKGREALREAVRVSEAWLDERFADELGELGPVLDAVGTRLETRTGS